jgi:hypothetical protein
VIVYLSIGNSDDKLSQAEWCQYGIEMIARVVSIGHTHGAWYSLPHTPYQNACWCVEFTSDADAAEARKVATEVRKKYRQDSVAWAVAETEFI